MTWLVTGGAGYIGAHVIEAFKNEGINVVALDNMASGKPEFVPHDVPLVEASVNDTSAVAQALKDYNVTGVVHLGGFKYAGVSVSKPLETYKHNVEGTAHLLEAMEEAGVKNLVFSSSAATYGTPDVEVVTEQTPTHPESPYGESKLIGEWLIANQAKATDLNHTSLRYFNVVGSGNENLYDASPHNLFPLVLNAILEGKNPKIFGDDYNTPDGTCVRDYVHVADLATSHVAAAKALEEGKSLEAVYNLGSGNGLSVQEIMDAFARVTQIDFEPEKYPRRPGDPAQIIASGQLAGRDLDWKMRHSIDDMVQSAYDSQKKSQAGF